MQALIGVANGCTAQRWNVRVAAADHLSAASRWLPVTDQTVQIYFEVQFKFARKKRQSGLLP
jgi:hypothetical protein